MAIRTTEDVKIPAQLISQVIGQKRAVDIVKKAAKQRRNILLIGEPGTGKTMLAQAMAELLPATDLEDVLVYKNFNDENVPLVKAVKTYPPGSDLKGDGQGRQILMKEKSKRMQQMVGNSSYITVIVFVVVLALVGLALFGFVQGYNIILLSAIILGFMIMGAVAMLVGGLGRRVGMGMMGGGDAAGEPKLIVDNTGMKHAPFIDATGARAGALFGDVRHDPLQCVPAGESVLLNNGNLIPIEQLVDPYFKDNAEGEIYLEESGINILGGIDSDFKLSAASVKRVYKRKYEGNIIYLKTRGGSRIRVTPNHPIAVLTPEGHIIYKSAGEMKSGERVVIPEKMEIEKGTEISEDLLLFIADALADGYIGERRIEFHLKLPFKIKLIEQDIRKLGFICKPKLKSDGSTVISLNSAKLCRDLRAMGIKEGNKKFVPGVIFKQDAVQIEKFLSRLISLDGYIGKQGQFEIVSSNRRFIQQIRALFLLLGVNPRYKTRLDTGFGKEKKLIQHVLRWNHFDWAKGYSVNLVNPNHRRNIDIYFKKTTFNKESFDDLVPLGFDVLESIRSQINISKERIHGDYWAINLNVNGSSQLTKALLTKVTARFEELDDTNPDTKRLRKLAFGDYAFDEIVEVTAKPYAGFVYNMTTDSGNYLIDFVLTHNSGGLGTPAHLRVESGSVHKANKGVLYIDEIANLEPRAQQELLTSLQEKRCSITGQSEMSSGALVKTEPAPCDFVLIAAGNLMDIQKMHPALRSRIRGYGYEVYMESVMDDNEKNRELLIQFIAQEIKKDAKIPPFDSSAIDEIINEARRRAGRKKKLTLILRDLGGIIRAAGDLAVENNKKIVTRNDVVNARSLSASIESQIVSRELEYRKDYSVIHVAGYAVGKVNGLAVVGNSVTNSGVVIPIVAEVTPAGSRSEGKFIPTGKLGKIATEAVKNVSAIIKKHMGRDIANYDMHVQFVQMEGVEGDSASISVAVSIISAMENVPIDQSVAMTGSLSVRGDVLPVGGVTSKVEAAIDAGIKTVIIPASNVNDVALGKEKLKKIKIITVRTLGDVLKYSLKECKRKRDIIKELKSGIGKGEGR